MIRRHLVSSARQPPCLSIRRLFGHTFPYPHRKQALMSTSSIQPEGSRQLCRQTFRGNHVDVFWSVAYTPDGRYIVSGSSSRDQPLLLWDVDKGEVVGKPFRAHSDPVHAAAVTPDGKTVISGSSDHTIRIWDLDSRRIIHTIETPASITSFALLPNGRHLVSASLEESAIRIWDIETGRSTMGPLEGHTGHVGAVVYSSDGKKLASCSWDDTVRVWDAATGRLMAGPFQVGRIYSIALSHDGRQFIYGGDQGKIQIRDAEDGRLVSQPLVKHKDGVLCLALSPDGGRIASGSYDHTVCIWDITTCKLIAGPFDGHTGGIHAVTYSPDAKFVASASDDETIRVWDVEAGVRAREILAANRPEQTDGVPHTSHAMTEHAGRQRAHHRTQPSQITQPSGSIPRADSLDSLILNLPATLPERTQGRNAMDHEDHDWDSFLEPTPTTQTQRNLFQTWNPPPEIPPQNHRLSPMFQRIFSHGCRHAFAQAFVARDLRSRRPQERLIHKQTPTTSVHRRTRRRKGNVS
ncbi:WD40 repeat-like protein [Leucogyrophana mollusca]|uniref:WD40 repeat-like protein n=1 Tax=Leucogyrophana mollusca TaxID=85980 RepID=A0ACB8B6X9_9AGAM|nr:WD40 repeat-like protein [Leucogyrophana mollusca]